MFSSLEAIDAEDSLNAAPVVRQGAFQPKAKPRVRKGGSALATARKLSSLSSAPAPIKGHEARPIHDADLTEAGGNPHVEAASSSIITAGECQGRDSPGNVADVFESLAEVVAQPQEAIASSLKESIATDALNGSLHAVSEGDDMGSLTTVLHDAPSAFEELLASHLLKPDQSTRKKHEPRRRSHSRIDKEDAPLEVARGESLSQQNLHQNDVLEPFTTGIESHESEVVAPSTHMDHSQTERSDKIPMDINEESLVEESADALGVEKPVVTTTKTAEKKRGFDQTKTHHGDATLSGDSIPPHETIKPKKSKFAIFAESVSASAPQAEEIADKLNVVKEFTQEAAVKNAVEPVKEKKKKGSNETKDIEKVSSNTVDAATSKQRKKAKWAAIFTATASVSVSQPEPEAANEGNCTNESVQEASISHAIEIAKRKKAHGNNAIDSCQGTLVSNSVDSTKKKKRSCNDAEEQQDIVENASSHAALASYSRGNGKRVTKKPSRFNDGVDDDFIRAITEESSKPLDKKRKDSSLTNKEEDNADDDLLITFVQEKAKGKKAKLSIFSATMSQPATVVEDDVGKSATLANEREPATVVEDDIGKYATRANEKEQKKKFKTSRYPRRRVERRLMNPANPDLDPKKMTMKDIIRLAEAKEKLLKNGNPKKPKDGNELAANAFEKEDETFESTCLAPQVQVVDGRIVINQESLSVNAHPKDDIRTYTRVEETHSKLNYHSYMKRTPKMTWKKNETDLFYEALREFGTNFAMIQHLFPGRTRKQVFLKYKKEERSCPLRIAEAMRVKPCETPHFLEVMSSLNLLSSESPDMIDSDPGVDPFDMTLCREEVESSNCMLAGADGCAGDDTFKLEEFPMQSESGEKHENNGINPQNSVAVAILKPDDNLSEEAPKAVEMTKSPESPHKVASPPRKKKSLFSYQTSATKS